jgi:hypothetical protein
MIKVWNTKFTVVACMLTQVALGVTAHAATKQKDVVIKLSSKKPV